MKYLFLTILFSMSYFELAAQKNTLQIEKDSLISKLLELKIKVNQEIYSKQYYNIQLFNGDFSNAIEIKKDITTNFPEENINLTFETPNYKVKLGPYRKYKEVLDLLKLIKRKYPASFIIEPKSIL
tara:strand:- start:1933 stop:2310 length:378 start_codon:yes stop_codon:yes gene_type:complete